MLVMFCSNVFEAPDGGFSTSQSLKWFQHCSKVLFVERVNPPKLEQNIISIASFGN